jgi:hypothetical protein
LSPESVGVFSKTQMDCLVAMDTALSLLRFHFLFLCFTVAACCCTWNLVDEFTFTSYYWQNNTFLSLVKS